MDIHWTLGLSMLLLAVSAASASCSVLACEAPRMAVRVEAGDYQRGEAAVTIAQSVILPIDAPERVNVSAEKHVLDDERARGYAGGALLAKTLGPVDVQTRLPYAIVPESVVIRFEETGGDVYREQSDYDLDHVWGGVSRVPNGSIPDGTPVYVDYSVYLQRIDLIQVSPDGVVSVRKGKSTPVCPRAPEADPGCLPVAAVYVPYRTTAIDQGDIFEYPASGTSWRDHVKVEGAGLVARTRGLLQRGEKVTIVCWGDSVTQGASATPHENCYVELFANRLRETYPRAQLSVINAGIGGSNTDTRRDGFESEVLAHEPDLITVEFVNDAPKTPETILHNYREFIERARGRNPEVEFSILTPHYMMPDWMGNFENAVPAMREAARANMAALGDTANVWLHLKDVGVPYEALLANCINHPDNIGHEFYAETLMRLLGPESR